MKKDKGQIVVITDLDGSLLDASTYSFDEALPALNLINERNIPLILSSSKTRVEIELYRKKLDNYHPFVSENGGGIFVPDNYFPFNIDGDKKENYTVINFGTPYSEVRKVFNDIKSLENSNAMGFGDYTVKEVSGLANMTTEEAYLSKEREYDEPFLFYGEEIDKRRFLKNIEERGFNWTEGRFLHILGDHDKGKAAKVLIEFYKKVFGNVSSIGLGDSLNDFPFLAEVDYPVLIPKEDGRYVSGIDLPDLIMAEAPGPNGWNKAVNKILENI